MGLRWLGLERLRLLIVGSLVLVLGAASAEEAVDLDTITAIRYEGFHHSQAMKVIEHLTEAIGPRLTNSPLQRVAAAWCRDQLEEWGLKNATLEAWGEFGRGWSFERATVHMLAPNRLTLIALPKAWTPGTDGPVRAEVMRVDIDSEEDFEEFEGKLAGKILIMSDARKVRTDDQPFLTRHSDEDLCAIEEFRIPSERSSDWRKGAIKRWKFRKVLADFLVEEGVVAVLELSSRDAGVVRVTGNSSYAPGENPGPPRLVLATEHYNRIARHIEREEIVELEIDVVAAFHEEETMGFNVVAEIPGSSKRREIVMLGGHLDSWHGGTGATDNGAGVTVAMEAVRILKALKIRPKRTIRIALWTGEEQGLLGSRAYVEEHFASRPVTEDSEQLELPRRYRKITWPLKTTRAHDRFSAYFNLDNGGGKIRGIYAQENLAVKPIFEAWLKPFEDLGATAVTLRATGSTDHVSFDAVGLPGFQFVQDPLEYRTRTHHTNMDVLDRIHREDLMQASVIMASFVYHAAMRDERLPRKPMPRPEPEKDADEKTDD